MKRLHKATCIALTTFFTVSLFTLESISPYYSFGLAPETPFKLQDGKVSAQNPVMTKALEVTHDQTHQPKELIEELDTVLVHAGLENKRERLINILMDILVNSEDHELDAIRALGEVIIKDEKTDERILKALLDTLRNDKSLEIRREVARVLGKTGIKDKRIVEALIDVIYRYDALRPRPAANSQEESLAEEAAKALAEIVIKDEKIVKALRVAMENDKNVRGIYKVAMETVVGVCGEISDSNIKSVLEKSGIDDEEIKAALRRGMNEYKTYYKHGTGLWDWVTRDKKIIEVLRTAMQETISENEKELVSKVGITTEGIVEILRKTYLTRVKEVWKLKGMYGEMLVQIKNIKWPEERQLSEFDIVEFLESDYRYSRLDAPKYVIKYGLKGDGILAALRQAFLREDTYPADTHYSGDVDLTRKRIKLAIMKTLGLLGDRKRAKEYVRSIILDNETRYLLGLEAIEALFDLGDEEEAFEYVYECLTGKRTVNPKVEDNFLGFKGYMIDAAGHILKHMKPKETSLTSDQKIGLWQFVTEFKKTRLEIITPKSFKLTDTMDKTIDEVNDLNRKDGDPSKLITINSLDKGPLLNALRRYTGTKKIIMADSALAQEIAELMKNPQNAKEFRDVRVIQITMPDDAYIAKQAHLLGGLPPETLQTTYQSKALQIAILSRLLENDQPQNKFIMQTLKELLAGTLTAGIKIEEFLKKLGATEADQASPKEIADRLNYFLSTECAVSLIRELHTDLIILKEFWTYA